MFAHGVGTLVLAAVSLPIRPPAPGRLARCVRNIPAPYPESR